MSEIDSPLRQSAPDTSRDAWPAVASLALGSFASVTTEFLPVGVLPDVVKSFGVSAGHGGLMMTLPGLFAALAAPGVLLVGKRIDRRTLLLALSVLLLASALTSAVSTQFGWMLLGRAMVGASLGAFWSMALAVAGRLVRADHVHYAAAAVFGGATTAMIVGVPFGTFVADLTSWRGAFLAAAALSAIALIVQIVALPALAATSSATPGAARLLAFARNRMAQRSMATITLLFAAHFGTYTFLVPLLNEAGFAGKDATWVLLAYGAFGFLSNALASRYVARSLRHTLLGATVLMAVTLLALPAATGLRGAVLALVALWGVAWGALPLALNMWHRQIRDIEDETVSAMFTLTTQVGIGCGTVLAGYIVDARGLGANYVTGAAVAALAVLVIVLLPVKGTVEAPVKGLNQRELAQ